MKLNVHNGDYRCQHVQTTTLLCRNLLQLDTLPVHKEATRARKERDRKDTLAILEYLCDRNPFTSDVSLRNIETGVVAEPDVNVDKAENIGTRTLEMMKGENVLSFSFKKLNQAGH